MDRRQMLTNTGAALAAAVAPTGLLAANPETANLAYLAFRQALQADASRAWTYHCNLACAAMDEGMEPMAANRVAAKFMKTAFGVEIKVGFGV